MRCRALVHILMVGVLDLSPEDGLPSGDHLLGVDFLFLGGLVVKQKQNGELVILHKHTDTIRVVPPLGQ